MDRGSDERAVSVRRRVEMRGSGFGHIDVSPPTSAQLECSAGPHTVRIKPSRDYRSMKFRFGSDRALVHFCAGNEANASRDHDT